MKRDGTRVLSPASPRQQWVVELWNNNVYNGYRMFPTQEQAQQFANDYDQMLAEFREQANK